MNNYTILRELETAFLELDNKYPGLLESMSQTSGICFDEKGFYTTPIFKTTKLGGKKDLSTDSLRSYLKFIRRSYY